MSGRKSKKKKEMGDWVFQELFQQVPFNIAIIDRDFTIVNANENFSHHFGHWKGKKCYQVYKNLDAPCIDCQAVATFEDGEVRVSDQAGIDCQGKLAHYVVHIAPLKLRKNAPIDYVVEMSRDIVETKMWQEQYQILFDRVPCYITVIDRNYTIVRANESFRRSFGDVIGKKCFEAYKGRKSKCPNCPAAKTFKDRQVHRSTQVGLTIDNKETYCSVSTSPLARGVMDVEHVIEISTDITSLKKLEEKIIEAERLAAVGQTVAGLAHSIKNILMGLEGGMYIFRKGLKKNNQEVMAQGWDMLERNFDKTTALVRDFLSFAKGRLPELERVHPNDLVKEIINLYKETSKSIGVTLIAELDPNLKKVPLDRKGIHTCLTNLVSNAIDACQMSETKDCHVYIRTRDENGTLVFSVTDDGCGIDSDIKSKIFTTFFTTKGGKGTGLGLLTTRKIVQEHGGKIEVQSRKGKGTTFTIKLPHKRLEALYKKHKAV